MYTALEKFNQAQRIAPAAAPQAPVPDSWARLADDDYLTGAAFKQASQSFAQQFQQQSNTAVELAASGNLALVQGRHGEAFAKYGPEIQATLTQIPKQAWTVDNLDMAVNLVRSRHLQDLEADLRRKVREEVFADIPPTMRPNGGAGSVPTSPIPGQPSLRDDKLPAAWRARAEAAHLTDESVREFCQTAGISIADFFKQFDQPLGVVVEEVGQKGRA